MDFADVLERIAQRLDALGEPFALIGGLGLASYGITRATLDLDLLVSRSAQAQVIEWMEAMGYETLYRSSGYSNHLHQDPRLGRVDFVYVDGDSQRALFESAIEAEGPGGISVRVPSAEHLIAMKVLAMKNDPDRRIRDLADIRELISKPEVDRSRVREYFEKRGLLRYWDELEA